MYHVALTYPEGSPEYIEVFETAVRHYPEDPIANYNLATIAIKDGNYHKARRHMEKCRDHEQALNNLGILYIMDGDYENAEKSFKKAMSKGSKEAAYNYQNLHSLYINK